jgi:ABC-type antimicrobial peptide transport system permease subunit
MAEFKNHLSVTDLFRLSLRVFKTKPVRTFLTVMGMSVGIGTVMFLISMGYGLQFILIGKLVTTEDSLMALGVSYPAESALSITPQTMEEIAKMPNVAEISPMAEFPAEIKVEGATGLIIARVINPSYFRLSGISPDTGRAFSEGEMGIILSNQAAKLINLTPDKSSLGKDVGLRLTYQGGSGDTQGVGEEVALKAPVKLTGIITDDAQAPFAFVSAAAVEKTPPFYKEILLKADNIDVVEGLRDKLIEKGFIISARLDLVNQAKKVMNIITTILGVFGIAALIVSAIGMFNTMIVGFLERIYEVGIMKSLGATDRDVKNLFLMESLLMGLSGGLGGVALGYAAGAGVNLVLSILAQRLGGKPITLFITPVWFVITTLILSSMIGLIAGFWPAHRSTTLSPKEAFKTR